MSFTSFHLRREKIKKSEKKSTRGIMDGGISAAIEVLIQNLINVVKKEYSRIRDLDEDTQQLQKTLAMIQCYLNDAEKKSITGGAVKIWLKDLEDVAFDAANVLDELSYHLLHKEVNKMKTPKQEVLSSFSSLNHDVARPRNMALKIEQINTVFESMNRKAADLSLQNIIVNAPAASHASFETNSFTRDPIFVGRDVDVPNLVGQLTDIRKDLIFSILAIVGMGGMGKSTLTRQIFNHQNMKARFESRIWVHVSQTSDPRMLFKKILWALTEETSDGVESEEGILKKLQGALAGKAYLLVLDDVWNGEVSKWEGFTKSLSGVTSTKGNGIIITTRNGDVASLVRPFHTHFLSGLSDEDCWSIIKAKAFENRDVPSELEIIGRNIARRCQGLPLAANVVGGVLVRKSEEEWGLVKKNWLSEMEGGKDISKILRLSFDHLPSPSLKQCFAYSSVFPKGCKIEKQELIELWMAAGFLQPDPTNDIGFLRCDQRNDLESVGNNIFNVLLQKSLLQVAERDEYGNVSSCEMHDMVHDMACSVSVTSQVRYWILEEKSSNNMKGVAKLLRILVVNGKIPGDKFSDFECLHVLILKGGGVKEVPDSIRKLIHLRNLNVSATAIENLPDWIGELHHLLTLRANNGRLKKLPSTLKYLINLTHLYIPDDVELPAEIGRLTCLQTLRYFTVGDNKGHQIEELGSLKNLKGDLKIRNLEKVRGKEEAGKANIFQKPNLFELQLEWGNSGKGERNDECVLEGLQPHPNLKKLGITGFKGKRFGSSSERMTVRDGSQGFWKPLKNLIEIRLSDCPECEEIPTLQHLENLKTLYLIELKKVRYINSSFNNLISLNISGLERLESLPLLLFYDNQNLSKLEIWECPRLRELPDGLHSLNSLEKLVICYCESVKSIGNPIGGQQSPGILRELRIVNCSRLMELPRQMVESWVPSLERLELRGLSSLKNLPMLIDCLPESARLESLKIVGVPKLMGTRSVDSWGLGSLSRLEIDVSEEWSRESSASIKETVDGILQGCSNSLRYFTLRGVGNWKWVPESIQHLTGLHVLKLENLGVEEVPQWLLGNLSSLRSLTLKRCNNLRRLPESIQHLTALSELKLENLRVEEVPQWLENLSSLQYLFIAGCNQLRRFPSGDALVRLTKLQRLEIKVCPKLQIDSEWGNVPNLIIVGGVRTIKSGSK